VSSATSPPAVSAQEVFRAILPLIPAQAALVDFGCGKGRVLIVASEFGFKQVRGVEFSKELCEIARRNCAIFKARAGVRTEFRIIEADVADYPIHPDEMVIFLFNPFNERVMASVLINICASLELSPRKILLIYHNPEYDQVFELCDDFVKLDDLDYWGYKFTVYSSSNTA
jgi:SAM-dependent methyltransferase